MGVLYPDPQDLRGGEVDVGAIYGYAFLKGKSDPSAARELLEKVQRNVVNMDQSGRQSVATFERGTGDALVTYEERAAAPRQDGPADPLRDPASTLVIESPAALGDSYVDRHGNRAVAEAFLEFLLGAEGNRSSPTSASGRSTRGCPTRRAGPCRGGRSASPTWAGGRP